MVPDSSRRTTLLALGGAGGSLAAGATAVTDSDSAWSAETAPQTDDSIDWPMPRYDAAGTGYNPDASGPRADPDVRWRRAPKGFHATRGSPVLSDGTCYAIGGMVVALDAASGETRYAQEGSYRSDPAVTTASAYSTDTLAVAGPTGVFGLNAGGGLELLGHSFGVERWYGPGQTPDFSVFGPPTAVPPVAVGGTVFAVVPGAGEVVALDANSGRVRWRRSPGDEFRRLAVRDGVVFAVNWPLQVTAYDADSGEQLWQTEVTDQMVLPPTATADAVIVPQRERVTALERSDGCVRWRVEHGGNATEGAAAVAEGRVFVQTNAEEGSLLALDLDSGEELWSAPVAAEGTPVVADGVVYATDYDGLVAVEAADGTVYWRREFEFPISTPAIGDGALYAVSNDSILALERSESSKGSKGPEGSE